ncbi:MAG: ribosomal protein S18-alanine N-acetyltransferase [Lachnospiraceae bacterium]|nr:ribosomal protein S18-alanine N-acetyltransferase [Ruminococcus sp.]MCM1275285.1 ribosomal protein S18-alanine N-acetyltransferase [Lachnospiraceae bacterium]
MHDIEELFAIERECFGGAWTREMLREELENPLSVAATHCEGGRLAAFALGRVAADEGELFQIGTLGEFCRRGIAEGLLGELHEKMRGRGAAVCFLEVRSRNAAAIALYEKCGYERISVRKGYYPDDDAVIMRKDL